MVEFCRQQAVSPVASRKNQANTAVTGVTVSVLNDSPAHREFDIKSLVISCPPSCKYLEVTGNSEFFVLDPIVVLLKRSPKRVLNRSISSSSLTDHPYFPCILVHIK